MPRTKVFVSASFEEGKGLFDWLKKFGQDSDDRFVYWDEFAFSTMPTESCDAILILNTPHTTIHTRCYPERIIAFMMEPGIPAEHPWMFKGLNQYGSVFSPLPSSSNTVISHGFMGWHFSTAWSKLSELKPPVKTKHISCIASNLSQLPGHRLRLRFIELLKQQMPTIDFFGKGSRFIPDKMDALLPYKYSIAIENASIPFYFTEKINDCFLAWTIPLYFGCKNIGRFFPGKSFISIDPYDEASSLRIINGLIEKDDWESRIDALREARELVLQQYQPLAGAAGILRDLPGSELKNIKLRPINNSKLQKGFSRLKKWIHNGQH